MTLVTVSNARGKVAVTVLQIQDRVNLGNAAELEKAARQAFLAGERNIVLDLSQAPSLTSAGIRSILYIHKLLSAGGTDKTKHLKLVSPTPYVQEVLQIAGLLDYVEVFGSLDEAVASY
jgi:anti-anti-sigma factor